jgi:hypothetical protein
VRTLTRIQVEKIQIDIKNVPKVITPGARSMGRPASYCPESLAAQGLCRISPESHEVLTGL